jgi:flagellar basal body rod protein FlgC
MFFNRFPNTKYDFDGQGKFQNIKNIFRSVRALPEFLDTFTSYKLYDVINGERPDIVSSRLYGTPQFYWTFFVVNDFLHDGYRAWPMSQQDLVQYFETQYEGFVITTDPEIVPDADGLDTFKNSIAGQFDLGEILHGGTSGAKGTLTKKDVDMNQLVIQDVTLGTAGKHPISGADDSSITGGQFIANEAIIQNSNTEQVESHIVYKYIDAPYQYYATADSANQRSVTNRTFINSSEKEQIAIDPNNSEANSDGQVFRTTNNTVDENFISFKTYREYETELNDARSQIRYVDPNYIGEFVERFTELLNE